MCFTILKIKYCHYLTHTLLLILVWFYAFQYLSNTLHITAFYILVSLHTCMITDTCILARLCSTIDGGPFVAVLTIKY